MGANHMAKLKILVFVLIFAFYASLLLHKIALPAADDLPRQIKIGESVLAGNFDILYKNIYAYTEPEHAFYNHHWLAGVIFYLIHSVVGWGGLVIFKTAVLLTAFVLVFLTATKKADFWLVAALSIPAILLLRERTGLRPEVFSYLFVAIYFYLLADWNLHPSSRRIWWLLPLQLLWVNIHVFFSIGIMMAAGFLAEKILLTPRREIFRDQFLRKAAMLVVSLILISLVNPRGVEGVVYRYRSDFPIPISENLSQAEFVQIESYWEDISVALYKPLVGVLAVSFLVGWRGRRRPYFYLFGSLATALLAFLILRGMYLFGVIFLLAASANFNDLFTRSRQYLQRGVPRLARTLGVTSAVSLVVVLGLLIWPGWPALSKYRERGIGLVPWSEGSAKFFLENNLTGPILNDPDIGSYLIYYLYPHERVFSDNRFADAYSTPFIRDTYLPMLADEEAWRATLAAHNFNVIWLYQYDAAPHMRDFMWRRLRDPEWSLVYVDTFAMLLVRNTPANQTIIDQYKITIDNVGERLKYLTDVDRFDAKVAAADIFKLIGRDDLAKKEYLNVVARWPEKGKVWMILGEIALGYDTEVDTVLGMMFLERAIAEGQSTAEAYSFLGAAYARMRQAEPAKTALRKALSINPYREDAKQLLTTIEQDTGR